MSDTRVYYCNILSNCISCGAVLQGNNNKLCCKLHINNPTAIEFESIDVGAVTLLDSDDVSASLGDFGIICKYRPDNKTEKKPGVKLIYSNIDEILQYL